jgi:hypothetical protein
VRKMRLMAIAIVAVLGLSAAAAYAQGNSYDFNGKVPTGGTKSKPKAGGFTFNFSINDPAGNVPAVVKTYKFVIGASKVNTSAVKATCLASKINAAGSDDACPSGAIVGTGSIRAEIGTAGQPWDGTTKCDLKLTAYNGGPNKVALYLDGTDTTKCVAPISQALDAKWTNTSAGAGLQFSVPDELRHQLGLDVSVVDVKSTWKKLTGKKGSKKVGYFETTGCKGKRSASVTFTTEDGTSTPVKKSIGSC